MKIKLYLEELKNNSIQNNTDYISTWLNKYNQVFLKKTQNTNCGKWQKYLNNNEIPYPCCCHTKDKNCIFLELYYNLKSLVKEDEPDIFFINNIIKRALNNY